MNAKPWVRLIAAAVVYLWAAVPVAQEMPAPMPLPQEPLPDASAPAPETPVPEGAPPSEEAAAVEPQPAVEPLPAVEPQPTAESQAAPIPGTKRIMMLPVEFTVYQKSVAGIEAVPDWTETAKYALGEAATQMLRQDNRFQIMAVPEIGGETQGLLREHVEFFKVVGQTATNMLQYGGTAWKEKKTNFDYTLGDGLGFLADASGADYAFILAGAQVTQTGGAVFLQFLAAAYGYAAAGGGTFMYAGIVDLRTGNVKWLNSRTGQQIFGVTGTDVRNPATASEVVTKMFEGFPESKLVKFPPF
jgi:hypothetical protein